MTHYRLGTLNPIEQSVKKLKQSEIIVRIFKSSIDLTNEPKKKKKVFRNF